MSTTTSESSETVSYVDLVRGNDRFRLLWSGQIISLLGDWFNLIASASLVATLTQSGIAVGGLFVVRMLAPFLISPFAGVAADRFNRQRLLVLADIGRALILVGFLFVRQPQHVWLLYVLTFIQLAMSGVFLPTRNAILPDLVSKEEIGAANALSAATWSVMLAVGAALGGLVSGQFGVYPAFVIDSLTYLASAVLIGRIDYRHQPALAGSDNSVGAAIRQYTDGLNYLWQNKDHLFIASQKAALGLTVSGAFQVAQVALAERVFVIGEGGGTGLGLIYAAIGVGTGLGPIIIRRFTGDRERPLRIAIAFSFLFTSAGLAIMAPLSNFGTVLGGALLRGFGVGTGWVFSTQLLYQLLPNRVRGRVFATDFAFFTLLNAISAAAGGWLLDSTDLGISGMLWLMAALTLIPGFLWTVWSFRPRPSLESKSLDEVA